MSTWTTVFSRARLKIRPPRRVRGAAGLMLAAARAGGPRSLLPKRIDHVWGLPHCQHRVFIETMRTSARKPGNTFSSVAWRCRPVSLMAGVWGSRSRRSGLSTARVMAALLKGWLHPSSHSSRPPERRTQRADLGGLSAARPVSGALRAGLAFASGFVLDGVAGGGEQIGFRHGLEKGKSWEELGRWPGR